MSTAPPSLGQALRLERNLALSASAGTGKTYSLVTLCLHLVAGARAGFAPLPMATLGLLTFTDKAAGEMRERLRLRLDALADDLPRAMKQELELAASFEALRLPFPDADFWRKQRDELGAASIGTFHALCTQLLRRAPAGAPVLSHFDFIDERDAQVLLEEVATREVLAALQRRDSPVETLVRELGLGSAGTRGLVSALTSLARRVREEGLAPESITVFDLGRARVDFGLQLDAARAAVAEAQREAEAKFREDLARIASILSTVTFETYSGVARELAERSAGMTRTKVVKPVALHLRQVGDNDLSLQLAAHASALVLAPLEEAARGLLTRILAEYEAVLRRRQQYDFGALLLEARKLLNLDEVARQEAQARFGALLVDEFQDTNRVQMDLVLLLAERRSGPRQPLPPWTGDAAFALEPGFLAIVGDRKQAIYEFRGADVSVFERVTGLIVASGGTEAWLRDSRRSSPRLIAALNPMMQAALGVRDAASLPFEVGYAAQHDDLQAVRAEAPALPPVLQLVAAMGKGTKADEVRALEAEGLARVMAQLLRGGEATVWPWRPGERGASAARPARGGDIAVLFQRFSQLEVYRQALMRAGVRHRVVRGRGFFDAQEVLDVTSFLRLLADPDDGVALLAVLRSPFVHLGDASLVRMALAQKAGRFESRPWVLSTTPPDVSFLSEAEGARFQRFRQTWFGLWREQDRLGLGALVRVAFESLGYREAVAGMPFGEQSLANLEKLEALARVRERSGADVLAFARELTALAEQTPSEAQGEVVDDLDGDAVTLLTVHQSKGLEWPIVVLPELYARKNNDTSSLRFDRDEGLALRPFETGPDEAPLTSMHLERLSERASRRNDAERSRLLYVAATRARDRLVLGLFDTGQKGSWAKRLEDAVAALPGEAVERVRVEEVPAPSLERLAPLPSAARDVAEALTRVRAAPRPAPRNVVLPVTQLGDFATCPRRFHFAQQVELAEFPQSFEWQPQDGDGEVRAGDPRARGSAAHRLLELTPLTEVGTPRLEAVLKNLARVEALPDDEEVLDWVKGFWNTRFGRAVAAGGSAQREVPFLLRLEAEDGFALHLKGQIDLLAVVDGAVHVIDYKSSKESKAGLTPYQFQLSCYALAARRLLGEGVKVTPGIVFLRDASLEPRYLEGAVDEPAVVASLLATARGLALAQTKGAFDGVPLATCDALACGYRYRCYGAR